MNAERNPIILTYHSISAGRAPLAVPLDLFAKQMEWLSRNCQVAPLGVVVNSLRQHRPLPGRTVVLTFDDGYQDFYTGVAAELRRYKFPSTVFLPTAYCGRSNCWPGQPAWVEERPLLTWPQVEELARDGIEFCPHSVTHPDMTTLTDVEIEQEMVESKRSVEEHTGRPAQFFCYPYGRWNLSISKIASRYFSGACSTAAGAVESDADPFALPRVDATYVRSAACFRSLFTRRFLGYLAVRRAIRRLRAQPEGSYARQ